MTERANSEPEATARFEAEVAESNLRRFAALLPVMAVVHVAHAVVFTLTAASDADPVSHAWRMGIARVHEATFVGVVLLTALVWATRGRGDRVAALVPALVNLFYLLHAAVVVGVDQLTITSVAPFSGYVLATVFIATQPMRRQIPIALVGLAAFVVSIVWMQPSADVRQAILPNGITVTFGTTFLSWFLWTARRRDFDQRELIEQQRRELSLLNQDLERRVEQQVAEIVARAAEVDTLNAHLQAQVHTRSTELTKALSTLAAARRKPTVPPDGAVLADRFELGAVLGTGGMGTVYEAYDRATKTQVAIKLIQARSAEHLDAMRRFLREARSTAAITHPAVVRLLHVDVSDDGALYQVLERVHGESLRDVGNRLGRLRPVTVARLGAVLCEALAAAHEQGVVHRDVKPGNVMIMPTPPGLKLLDFGIARLYEGTAVVDGQTDTGIVIGTPAFMSPEQLAAAPTVNDRTDLYAVGVTLFLLLTGRYPFDDVSYRGMLRNQLTVAPDVRTFEPDVDAPLAAFIARCLERTAEKRASAAESVVTLNSWADRIDRRTLDALVRERALTEMNSNGATVRLDQENA